MAATNKTSKPGLTMTSTTVAVAFPVPSITADPQSVVTACEDAELAGQTGPSAAGEELRFVEVSASLVKFPQFLTAYEWSPSHHCLDTVNLLIE